VSAVRRVPEAAVDLVLLLTLGAAALAGLATTFTGAQFFVVGMLGLATGAGLAWLTTRQRWPFVAAVLLALVVFYVLGGPLCLRAVDAVAPTPRTFGLLTDQLLFGWKDMLTTLPPLDGAGPLLVLPWFLGLTAGVLGMLLARVERGPVWLTGSLPLLAPVALVAAVVLLGVERPQSLLLQGFAVAVLALAWLAVRVRRGAGVVQGRSGHVSRLVGGTALVAVAGLLALPVGSWASGDDDRLILREHVDPPFDIGQYASPLSSFRRYVEDEHAGPANVYDDELFRVEGAPAGTRIRFAALDTYDGVVWGAGADSIPESTADTFQRVSSEIHNPADGDALDVSVTVADGYSGPWLPTFGGLQGLHFTRGDTDAKSETFRYNLATSTAVVPSGLHPGDRYEFRTVATDEVLRPSDSPPSVMGTARVDDDFLETQATQWSAGESEPIARVFAIAAALKREADYSDGVLPAERIYHPGHHRSRLGEEFVDMPIKAGNDEQYAALMALLVHRVGIPSRVVMGASVPSGGVVHGKDVSAWVEVQVADGSWRTLPTEEFMDFSTPAEQPPQTKEELSGMVVPPPAPIPPPSTIGEQTDAELNAHRNRKDSDDEGFSVPGWLRAILVYVGLPLLVLAALVGAVVGAKALRRRRRRTHVVVSRRFVGAWRELVDHARDLGTAVPSAGTRREQALLVATAAAPGLARQADQHVFGPSAPAEADAAAYWEIVEAERRAMSAGVPRWQRLLGAVDVRTFVRR